MICLVKISTIDGGVVLRQRQLVSPAGGRLQDIVRQLRQGPTHLANYDYDGAVVLADAIGWDVFAADGSRTDQLRRVLAAIGRTLRPVWFRVAHLGRLRVCHVLADDTAQCFRYAKLLADNPTPDVVSWWDALGCEARLHADEQALVAGREGENRTLAYERRRLMALGIDREPKWVALDDNTAGFDVLSFDRGPDGALVELKIEVKAHRHGSGGFRVTRGEWDCAMVSAPAYVFHVWDLDQDHVTILRPLDLQTHLPVDRGSGRWESARIRMPIKPAQDVAADAYPERTKALIPGTCGC